VRQPLHNDIAAELQRLREAEEIFRSLGVRLPDGTVIPAYLKKKAAASARTTTPPGNVDYCWRDAEV
jgi:hypothetical protein